MLESVRKLMAGQSPCDVVGGEERGYETKQTDRQQEDERGAQKGRRSDLLKGFFFSGPDGREEEGPASRRAGSVLRDQMDSRKDDVWVRSTGATTTKTTETRGQKGLR